MLIGIIIVVGGSLMLHRSQQSVEVPTNLVGRWMTENAAYADRILVIEAHSITFGIGGNAYDRYAITRFETEKEAEQWLCTIYFKDKSGVELKRSVYYSPAGRGEIWFKNQEDIVWVRVPFDAQ
jgi:hypothetical protein